MIQFWWKCVMGKVKVCTLVCLFVSLCVCVCACCYRMFIMPRFDDSLVCGCSFDMMNIGGFISNTFTASEWYVRVTIAFFITKHCFFLWLDVCTCVTMVLIRIKWENIGNIEVIPFVISFQADFVRQKQVNLWLRLNMFDFMCVCTCMCDIKGYSNMSKR